MSIPVCSCFMYFNVSNFNFSYITVNKKERGGIEYWTTSHDYREAMYVVTKSPY